MSGPRSATRLDPRAPLVLDTRELGRRAGSMRAVRRTVPAPAGWGLELVEVPAGSDLELDLRLESVVDGVLVSGTVETVVTAECGRCLEPVMAEVTADVQELFVYESAPDDESTSLLEGDFLDLEPIVRDAIVLAMPLNPVCDEDCAGLCTGCGERLVDLPEEHSHDASDPRWSALAVLTTPPDNGVTSTPPETGS